MRALNVQRGGGAGEELSLSAEFPFPYIFIFEGRDVAIHFTMNAPDIDDFTGLDIVSKSYYH